MGLAFPILLEGILLPHGILVHSRVPHCILWLLLQEECKVVFSSDWEDHHYHHPTVFPFPLPQMCPEQHRAPDPSVPQEVRHPWFQDFHLPHRRALRDWQEPVRRSGTRRIAGHVLIFPLGFFFFFLNTRSVELRICQAVFLSQVADYIPQLAKFSPDLWGVALCTVDGQRWAPAYSHALLPLNKYWIKALFVVKIAKWSVICCFIPSWFNYTPGLLLCFAIRWKSTEGRIFTGETLVIFYKFDSTYSPYLWLSRPKKLDFALFLFFFSLNFPKVFWAFFFLSFGEICNRTE